MNEEQHNSVWVFLTASSNPFSEVLSKSQLSKMKTKKSGALKSIKINTV